MGFGFFRHLRAFLDRHADHPAVHDLRRRFAHALSGCRLERLLSLYDEALELAEALTWVEGANDGAVDRLQALHREREQLLALHGSDRRHRFVVVIPVADRPRQLERGLQSLLDLCHAFEYGGREDGRYRAVRVVVADDSADAEARRRHAELARRFSLQGLRVDHFSPEDQAACVARVEAETRSALAPALGPFDPNRYWHKGPSRVRNIVALHLARSVGADELVWFVDSDEEFQVLQCTREGRRERAAVNYFHHLDVLFRTRRPEVVTGKVVGDPPVAPAVMIGNFLDDLAAFLERAAALEPQAPCPFHETGHEAAHGAYHDLAQRFGLDGGRAPHPYRCTLPGKHDLAQAFDAFTARLDGFFDGAHPTRVTCFQHRPPAESLAPARTVYTGNYVVSPAGLRHFIPFAHLGLRMAGPVLGRLLRAELGDRFLSANLPLLHRRVPPCETASEYRSGVARSGKGVDLSDEFRRQFLGDLMLFTVERLVQDHGYPGRFDASEAERVLEEVAASLVADYRANLERVWWRLEEIGTSLSKGWWRARPAARGGAAALDRFLDQVAVNFGPDAPGVRWLTSETTAWIPHRRLLEALAGYPEVSRIWRRLLHRTG